MGLLLSCPVVPFTQHWGTAGSGVPLLSACSAALFLSLVQVYRLLFGASPLAPDDTHERDTWDRFGHSEKMAQLEVRSMQGCGRAKLILYIPSAMQGCLKLFVLVGTPSGGQSGSRAPKVSSWNCH